ncbi:ankyrin repeat-containing domain protein [Astrocystis sublimbata]|nr:ankyrin repeat-containing domain protein [Astrocystis sublimbata]
MQADPDWNTTSIIGRPLDCSIGRTFSLHRAAPLTPIEIRDSFATTEISYATHRPGQVITMMEKKDRVLASPSPRLGGCSLMICASHSAMYSLDLSPVSRLICMDWVISDKEATVFERIMKCLVEGHLKGYLKDSHGNGPPFKACLFELVTVLNKYRVHETEAGYKMCLAAWDAAVGLKCEFATETTLMDTSVTLSLEALLRNIRVAISCDGVESMRKYLSDKRIAGPETDDDGTDACGQSLLRQAITKNSVKILELLTDLGYSLEKPFHDGALPIHVAWNCKEGTIGFVLKLGISHLQRDSRGNNIWHLAAEGFEHDTLSALLKLTGDEKSVALRAINDEGFTPLTLSIKALTKAAEHEEKPRVKKLKHAQSLQDGTVRLLLDESKGDALCWQCPGSIWHLAAQSNSVLLVNALAKSDIRLPTVQEGQPTPLHLLNGQASKEFIDTMIGLFPTANRRQHEGKTPLESFLYRCIEQAQLPMEGVIDGFLNNTSSSDLSQIKSCLWKFCTRIIGSPHVYKSSQSQESNWLETFANIFRKCLQIDVIEAYEDLTGESATIPLFRAFLSPGSVLSIGDDIKMVISRTRWWDSACLANETIEYVKMLMKFPEPSHAHAFHTLLSHGVDVHIRSRSSSILEKACGTLACGNQYSNGTSLSPQHTIERQVFKDIVDHSRSEELNASHFMASGYLTALVANRKSISGARWMITTLVAKGLDLNKRRLDLDSGLFLVLCLVERNIPLAQTLLELGADPSARGVDGGWNAVHAASNIGIIDFLTTLLDKLQVSPSSFPWQATTSCSQTHGSKTESFTYMNALHLASLGNNTLCVQFFIENKLIPGGRTETALGFNCLHFSAVGGATETIKYLHSIMLDINQPAVDGKLPLHLAVQFNNPNAVKILVELGSALSKDKSGMTPQMHAKALGHAGIMQCLQESIRNSSNTTHHLLGSLEDAIASGDLEECKTLEDCGLLLDLPMPSCGACSPLVAAVRAKAKDIAIWLLSKRVSVLPVACERHSGKSAVQLAIQSPRAIHYLKRILDLNLETAWSLSLDEFPLGDLAEKKGCASLKLVIEHIRQNSEKYSILTGVPKENVLSDMINTEHEGFTSLHEAVIKDNLENVKVLLDAGADVDALSHHNLTAILHSESPQMTEQLLAAGSRTGWLDSTSWGSLYEGSDRCTLFKDIIRPFGGNTHRIWSRGARNFPRLLDDTFDKYELINKKLLISAVDSGLDLNVTDYHQLTPIHAALHGPETSKYLLTSPQITECKPFPWHTMQGQLQDLPWINEQWRFFKKRMPLANFGNMLNLHPREGISPLCQAAAIDLLDVIDRCLEMGAKIDFEGSSYGSALMAACANCRLKAVKHLVRRGASIVYNGEFGEASAIVMANGHVKIIAWLLVGQFTEQLKLEYQISEDPDDAPPLRYWSGIREERMPLNGFRERRSNESLKKYVYRLAKIREEWRGRALPIHNRDYFANFTNIVCYRI